MTDMIVLPLRVVPQPMPHLNPGGDCGACVLAGLTGWTIEAVYKQIYGDRIDSLSLYEMQKIVRQDYFFGWTGYQDSWPMIWSDQFAAWQAFGIQARHQQAAWFRYVKIAMEAGYYSIANVRYDKTGPNSSGPDHWILICGAPEILGKIGVKYGKCRS